MNGLDYSTGTVRANTVKVVDFIVKVASADIPSAAADVAVRCILDFTGVALAGGSEPVSRAVWNYLGRHGASGDAFVVGADRCLSTPDAALANGCFGHAMDYDDSSVIMAGHPSAAIVPALYAVALQVKASGSDLVNAYVVAYELVARLMAVAGSRLGARGYHATSAYAPMASAAATARLLGLDEDRTALALGLAATTSGGLVLSLGTMGKPLQVASGCRAGVAAALLADAGVAGPDNVFDGGRLGWLPVLGDGTPVPDGFADSLGTEFHLADGIEVKLHPSCARTHPGIDAALAIVARHAVRADDVADVEIVTSSAVPAQLPYPRPRDALQAKFSLEYGIAAAFVDGEVGIAQYTDRAVLRPQILEFMRRIRYMHPDPQPGHQDDPLGPELVVVHLTDGRTVHNQMQLPPGELAARPDLAGLIGKYRSCAKYALRPEYVDRSIAALLGLPDAGDIAGLVSSISGNALRPERHLELRTPAVSPQSVR